MTTQEEAVKLHRPPFRYKPYTGPIFEVAKHGRQWGIFATTIRAFVSFGPKAVMQKRCNELNEAERRERA